MSEIQLGEKVRCKITGFLGIAVAKTEFINGCIQFTVAPKWNGKGNPVEQEIQADAGSLELLKQPKKKIIKKDTGGASRRSFGMRGH